MCLRNRGRGDERRNWWTKWLCGATIEGKVPKEGQDTPKSEKRREVWSNGEEEGASQMDFI